MIATFLTLSVTISEIVYEYIFVNIALSVAQKRDICYFGCSTSLILSKRADGDTGLRSNGKPSPMIPFLFIALVGYPLKNRTLMSVFTFLISS